MVPFKETITTKAELIEAAKKGFDDYQKKLITKNDFCMFFGFIHGEAIERFYKNDYEQLLVDGGFNPGSSAYFSGGINAWKNLRDGIYEFPPLSKDGHKQSVNKDLHLQQIYYGAPGTGKSHEIKKLTEGESVIRTTFHPDSDYSTFVGAYKPTMEDVDVRVVPVVEKSGISLEDSGTYKEKRIVYKFVMQAFLKAYLGAWKKYADAGSLTNPTIPSTLHFNASGAHYTITRVNDIGITCNRKFKYSLKNIASVWNEIWKSGTFVMPSGRIPGRSLPQAVSQWIKDNIEKCTKDSLEEGLTAFKKEIANSKSVVVSKGTQEYTITATGNEDICLVSADSTNKRNTLKEYYSGKKDIEDATEIKRKLVEKLVEYDADSFDNAWDKMKEAVDGNQDALANNAIAPAPQFLIIEEINRGNCAQIFGDLFQLLDRGDNGFSEYPIEADADLQQEIEKAFKEHKDYRIENDIDVDDVVEDYTSNYGATLSEDIQHGRVLLLPNNLYIWATMNTSDQSLFPIDSAFKRRWDWEYLPIGYKNSHWTIKIGEKEYNWTDFQRKVNEKIYGVDNSEDKQLGDFFVNADRTGGVISADTLLNKILFYLWNDVCKDDSDQIFCWIDDKKEEKSIKFSEFFAADKDTKLQGLMKFLEVPERGKPAVTGGSEDAEKPAEDEVTSAEEETTPAEEETR